MMLKKWGNAFLSFICVRERNWKLPLTSIAALHENIRPQMTGRLDEWEKLFQGFQV